IGSTQDRARALADAGEGAAVIVTEQQTAGHGRQGRAWLAPRGSSLLASWVFRPLPSDASLFALLAGVAVARSLAQLGVSEAVVDARPPSGSALAGRPGAARSRARARRRRCARHRHADRIDARRRRLGVAPRMSKRFGIVIDGTASLPEELARALDVHWLPLK